MAKICIDAGHGGKDPGACGYGRQEKADVLSVALKVGGLLAAKGHSIYYTRTNDIYESPYQKAAEANSVNADFFASFHRNSFIQADSNGYETCVYSDTGKAKACADKANAEMAALGFRNRGTKIRTDLTVLNSTRMEAALFEIGFITNQNDNSIFASKFDAICVGLANAILAAVGGGTVTGGGTPEKIPTVPSIDGKKELGHVDCIYQAFAERWWPPVENRADWAGKGDNTPITYLGICVSKGSIRGRVYTQKNGWLPYLTFTSSYNINDLVNGVLGDGSPILAVELYYYTPDGYLYKEVHYCVSVSGNNAFYAKQIDNKKGAGYDGYAGDKRNFIDKFQAWIE
ncbi:MAG TPA: N-acetylmuramoyl-L-alanine amidase [Candidatus Mediterraneibacter pullistercoris]|nr:N-acetylmuramoyl-L-alanine amidase [Candidatus Mediterraneibacter pullistercoris]